MLFCLTAKAATANAAPRRSANWRIRRGRHANKSFCPIFNVFGLVLDNPHARKI
jgi:hypothetical protein